MPIEALNDQNFENITFEDICGAIADQVENEVFDIKQSVTSRIEKITPLTPPPVSIEKIVKIIISFMNGNANSFYGYIFIGIAEKEDGTPNLESFHPVSFGENPFISMEEGDKKKKKLTTRCRSSEEFIEKIRSYLKNNTIPEVDVYQNSQAVLMRIITSPDGHSSILAIKVKQNNQCLIQYKKDKKFYGRVPKINADDYQTDAMEYDEISKRYMARYYNPTNMPKPFYYDYENTIPAIPELTLLFDAIYYGRLSQVKVLLEQIPTLVWMTDSTGMNALHIASLYKRIEIVELLITEKRMSLLQTNHRGEDPFRQAAQEGNELMIKYYLNNFTWSNHSLEEGINEASLGIEYFTQHNKEPDAVERVSDFIAVKTLLQAKLTSQSLHITLPQTRSLISQHIPLRSSGGNFEEPVLSDSSSSSRSSSLSLSPSSPILSPKSKELAREEKEKLYKKAEHLIEIAYKDQDRLNEIAWLKGKSIQELKARIEGLILCAIDALKKEAKYLIGIAFRDQDHLDQIKLLDSMTTIEQLADHIESLREKTANRELTPEMHSP